MAVDLLTARLEDLRRADYRIARLAGTVRTADEEIPVRAALVLAAIGERDWIAAAVLNAIAIEDQALNARLAAAAVWAADAPALAEHLLFDREESRQVGL